MTFPMTSQGLMRLCLDEGLRLTAYPDPLSGGDPWTIGFGSTGPGITRGTVWALADAIRNRDTYLVNVAPSVAALFPIWRTLAPARRDVFLNMAYEMGVHGLEGFERTIDAANVGNFIACSSFMLASDWARGQASDRAHRLSATMTTGVWGSLDPPIRPDWVGPMSVELLP